MNIQVNEFHEVSNGIVLLKTSLIESMELKVTPGVFSNKHVTVSHLFMDHIYCGYFIKPKILSYKILPACIAFGRNAETVKIIQFERLLILESTSSTLLLSSSIPLNLT